MFMDFWRAVHVRAILRYTVFKKALRLAPWASKDPDLTQGKRYSNEAEVATILNVLE